MIAFRPLFSKSVFANAVVLVVGAVLAPGRRTVAAALRAAGLGQEPTFCKYHRVLSRAQWSARQASRVLLAKLVGTFVPEGPLVFGVDDTRRWGPKIEARGIYRDPVRSSRGHFVKASGLRWLSLMLLAPVSWAGRVWALPFLTVLCPSERFSQTRRKRHKKLTVWARQMVCQLRRWLPGRKLVVVGDSSFAAIELLAAASGYAAVVTRLRLDAALYEPAPPRPPGQLGRPRMKGERLPKLEERLTAASTKWQEVEATWWYGRTEKRLEVATGTAVWYHSGTPVVPLRWVLVRDPKGDLDPKGFLCTDQGAEPADILRWFVRRWSVEVTFEEVRAHLGMETQRQWSDLAILRTTPCLLGLFSLVALMAHQLERRSDLQVQQTAWHEKEQAAFSDALASVRRKLWQRPSFLMSDPPTETLKYLCPCLSGSQRPPATPHDAKVELTRKSKGLPKAWLHQ
jgi:hypothetical protein